MSASIAPQLAPEHDAEFSVEYSSHAATPMRSSSSGRTTDAGQVLTRNPARLPRMTLWLGKYGVQPVARLLEVSEGEQPDAGGKDVTDASVGGDNRSARRQVARAAVTEPSGSCCDVPVFRDAELCARTPYESSVPRRCPGDASRVDDAPAVSG